MHHELVVEVDNDQDQFEEDAEKERDDGCRLPSCLIVPKDNAKGGQLSNNYLLLCLIAPEDIDYAESEKRLCDMERNNTAHKDLLDWLSLQLLLVFLELPDTCLQLLCILFVAR